MIISPEKESQNMDKGQDSKATQNILANQGLPASTIARADARPMHPVVQLHALESARQLEQLSIEIERWSRTITALQRENWSIRSPLSKVLRRLIVSRLLYRCARSRIFSEKKRAKFFSSAQKRDPLLTSWQLDEFCSAFTASFSTTILSQRASMMAHQGITVTAIVPNYNHARFLKARLDSIINQTYPLVEIVILDDASTDDSRDVIDSYLQKYPGRIRAIFNARNSGSVFSQWKKGHEAATGDLVWFCESDDFCEPTFLERLLPSFEDPSVMLAFGKIQFANEAGQFQPGLDQYRESAEAGIWNKPVVRPAHEWFTGAFGVKNLIANVGGSVWKRYPISESVWETAKTFKIMGDWYLYSAIPQGGQIAYEPSAVSNFRIHKRNTSVEAQKQAYYYDEYARLMQALQQRWAMPRETVERFVSSCRKVFNDAAPAGLDFDKLLSVEKLEYSGPRKPHILIGILGFSYGGGEIFPIHLANHLHRRGNMVSIVQLMEEHDHPNVRAMLDPGIPVSTARQIRQTGIRNFLEKAGVTLIHAHMASVESFFIDEGEMSLPYVVTLHGSYEAMSLPGHRVGRWAKHVTCFTYLAERNLQPFQGLDVSKEKFFKFKNAMPVDERPFPASRQELGIAEDATIFTLVARGVEGKGWCEAVMAFQALEKRLPEASIALLFAGDGPETEKARVLAAGNPRIRFLGFVQQVHGLYRFSDVALAPTRYAGESFPLCLIQAMQVGTPCVATDIGEIRSMMEAEGGATGIIIPYSDDTDTYVENVSAAMETMLDPATRTHYAKASEIAGKAYDMESLAALYEQLYEKAIKA